MDYIDKIIAYESGELKALEVIKLFAGLIASGQAWSLQGHYGRTAGALIDKGLISKAGLIDWANVNELIHS